MRLRQRCYFWLQAKVRYRNPMKIIIPMSGFGERFRKAGYTVPKPLIEVDGKPIIAHVVDLFPGESDFLFICNREHLDDPQYGMRETLLRYCPTGQVVGIEPHRLGPVHAVLQVIDLIDDGAPVVVNYCDFACYWDWKHFKRFVTECECDGAIPAYRGFHPHSLGTMNYAYMREAGGWMLDIQEKQPFTENRMSEYASTGTYYFASGRLLKKAFSEARAQDLTVNGELYASLAYKPLLASGSHIAVYEVQHFMQWGTPEDLSEYRMWTNAFRRLVNPKYSSSAATAGTIVVPMAGLGERFTREGYSTPKPLIPVSGRPMVVQAALDLPASREQIFVLRRQMPGFERLELELKNAFPAATTVILDEPTDGQARTAMIGWQAASAESRAEPLTIGPCDNGALYHAKALERLITEPETDVIVWVTRGYANALRNPRMYGWVACEGDRVVGVSVKTPLAHPETDPIITGTFTFRRGVDFERAFRRMVDREARINGEYYVDTCIEDAVALGLTVKTFEIESYLCWGTPNDLRTFEYWQSCFDKWSGHPYDLEKDARVPADAVPALRERYRRMVPVPPRA